MATGWSQRTWESGMVRSPRPLSSLVTKLFMLLVNADEKGLAPRNRVKPADCPGVGRKSLDLPDFVLLRGQEPSHRIPAFAETRISRGTPARREIRPTRASPPPRRSPADRAPRPRPRSPCPWPGAG